MLGALSVMCRIISVFAKWVPGASLGQVERLKYTIWAPCGRMLWGSVRPTSPSSQYPAEGRASGPVRWPMSSPVRTAGGRCEREPQEENGFGDANQIMLTRKQAHREAILRARCGNSARLPVLGSTTGTCVLRLNCDVAQVITSTRAGDGGRRGPLRAAEIAAHNICAPDGGPGCRSVERIVDGRPLKRP